MSYRQAFASFYTRSFDRRPWLTLAITNGLLGVVADSVAQSLELVSHRQQTQNPHRTDSPDAAAVEQGGREGRWDWERNARFLAFNVGMAPLLAEWNRFIEYRFPLRVGGAASPTAGGVAGKLAQAGKVSLKALGKRVAVDQVAFAPFGLAMFVGAMGLMERRSLQGTKDKFSEMYTSALLANWQVWPLVQLVNFRYMPLQYRVPFVSTVGILWTVGLSLLSQASAAEARGRVGADGRAAKVRAER